MAPQAHGLSANPLPPGRLRTRNRARGVLQGLANGGSQCTGVDSIAFSFPDLDAAAAELVQKGIQFQQAPQAISNGPVVKNAFVVSPDDVRIELVQP